MNEDTPQIVYFRGGHGLPLDLPLCPVYVDSSACGAYQRFFRSAPSPDIDDLDRDTVYAIGVAMDRCGVVADQRGKPPDQAFDFHGELAETANAHVQAYRDGAAGPLTAGVLIETFCKIAGFDRETGAAILSETRRIVLNQDELLAAFMATRQQRQAPGTVLYADPSIETACVSLLSTVPTYHIESTVYDQCEVAEWPPIEPDPRLFPHPAFAIAVDDQTWPTLVDDPTQQAQTEWLIVDGRESVWCFYERALVRGIGRPNQTQVAGATADSKTGQIQCIESTSTFVPVDGEYQRWTFDDIQANRMLCAALSFMLVLQDDQVAVTAQPQANHWNVALPPGQRVNEVIERVLTRAKRSA